jgi:hypothetical protein
MDLNMKSNELIRSSKEIKTNIFTTSFVDENIEKNYLSFIMENIKNLVCFYFTIISLTYIAMIIYGLFVIKLEIFFIANGISLAITLILFISYFYVNCPFKKSWLEISVFLIFLFSLIINSFSFYYMNFEEFRVLRIIYCVIILIKFSLLIWSRTIFWVSSLICLINVSFLIIWIILLKNFKTSIVDEIAIEILLSIICFVIKKFYDSNLRITFLERIKYQKYFYYNKKLINCMSGLHFTFSENRLIYMNDNIKSLLNSLMNDKNFKGKILNVFSIFLILFIY